MASFLLFLPPPDRQDDKSDVEAMRLVRDGFRPWAFLFGPLWFVAKRLWLGTFLVLIGLALVLGPIGYFRTTATALGLITTLLAFLIGLEASTIERWTLRRRGWREAGVVIAKNAAEAEQKAAETLIDGDGATPNSAMSMPPRSSPPAGPAPSSQDYMAPGGVIGLFPEPSGR